MTGFLCIGVCVDVTDPIYDDQLIITLVETKLKNS